ncbi:MULTISPECIES: acyltransferase family protein [Alistipes]|uniref:Acyltransferase n=1 Tax=Alistipes intestinihominis TaxID=3133172 RepID=A0ABV1H0A5_9BACT|nr:acyltransferase [Alistipes senegalensis]
MSSKNRIEYIDAMRGFTMILVVYAHVVFFSFGIDSSYPSFNQFFMLMRMPLFFFISGFIFYRETTWTSKIVSQFIWKKFKVQVVSTLIIYTIFVLILQRNFWDGITTEGKYGYWFTITLFEFFLLILVPIIFSQLTKLKLDTTLIIFSLSIFLLSLQPINSKLGLGIDNPVTATIGLLNWKYFIYFTLGVLAKKHFNLFLKLIDIKQIFAIIWGGEIILYILLAHVKQNSASVWDSRICFIMGIGVAILSIIITFAVFRHYQEYFSKQKRIGRVLQFIGTRTLDIYLLHYILIPRDLKMVGCFFKTYTNPLLEFSVSILLALVIIVACLAMSATIRSSTFMSSLLFGVKSKSNNIING